MGELVEEGKLNVEEVPLDRKGKTRIRFLILPSNSTTSER